MLKYVKDRRDYILAHFGLTRESPHSDVWVAYRVGIDGGYGAEFRGPRSEVIRKARADWGHFSFDDEAEAFGEIFPKQA